MVGSLPGLSRPDSRCRVGSPLHCAERGLVLCPQFGIPHQPFLDRPPGQPADGVVPVILRGGPGRTEEPRQPPEHTGLPREIRDRPAFVFHHGSTVMRFSTPVTPGADQAARSASSFSAHDRTVPVSVTPPPLTST